MTNYKRQYRELSDETKQKISQSIKGTHHNEEWRKAASAAMKKYWSSVPSKHQHNQDGTTINDIMLENRR